jgi:hypothetical protein
MTHNRPTATRIPVLAWALVAAAAVQLAIWAAMNWYRIFGPYLIVKLEDASAVIGGVAPFILAAAVLVGAARWPAGRGWLYAGAGLFALHGVVQSATDAWWAWWMTDPVAPEGAVQVALVAGSLTAVAAAALAPICLALGLIRSRPTRPVSALSALVPLAVGAVAVVASVGLLGRELAAAADVSPGGPALIALGLVHRHLPMLGALGLVALAVAAVRARPEAGMVPEMLVAVGATLACAGSAATWVGQWLLSFEAQGTHLLWVFTLPWTASSIGMVLLIAGFGLAALGTSRARA